MPIHPNDALTDDERRAASQVLRAAGYEPRPLLDMLHEVGLFDRRDGVATVRLTEKGNRAGFAPLEGGLERYVRERRAELGEYRIGVASKPAGRDEVHTPRDAMDVLQDFANGDDEVTGGW